MLHCLRPSNHSRLELWLAMQVKHRRSQNQLLWCHLLFIANAWLPMEATAFVWRVKRFTLYCWWVFVNANLVTVAARDRQLSLFVIFKSHVFYLIYWINNGDFLVFIPLPWLHPPTLFCLYLLASSSRCARVSRSRLCRITKLKSRGIAIICHNVIWCKCCRLTSDNDVVFLLDYFFLKLRLSSWSRSFLYGQVVYKYLWHFCLMQRAENWIRMTVTVWKMLDWCFIFTPGRRQYAMNMYRYAQQIN
jgi:hypothetical protein